MHLIALCLAMVSAPSGIDITMNDHRVLKGFGLFPAGFDRKLGTYADGSPAIADATWLPAKGSVPEKLHRTVCDLGFEIARVCFPATLSTKEGVLDPDRLQDLKDHLTILRRCGIPKTMVTNWSPPAYMKVPDRVAFGKFMDRTQTLDPAYADGKGYDYADYILQVLTELRKAGFAPPIALSIQNEPDVAQTYDSCVWDGDEAQRARYRQVVVQVRRKLDAAGFRQAQLLAPEDSGYEGIVKILGEPTPQGFSAMQSDPAFRAAVGGFAYHTYYTSGRIAAINAARRATPDKLGWMTEYSGPGGIRGELLPKSGVDQLDWALNFVRRMAGDIVDLESSYWFFWRGWRPVVGPGDQDLVYGDSQKTKAYHVFREIWTTVKGGWRVKRVACDPALGLRTDNRGLMDSGSGDQWSAPVDVLAFEAPDAQRTCLVLVNASKAPILVPRIAGLRGRCAMAKVTDPGRDMAPLPVPPMESGAVGPLELPPLSIVVLNGGN